MILTADRDGERLDAAVARLAPALSRSAVQKLIAEGAVTRNGRPARKKREDRLRRQAGGRAVRAQAVGAGGAGHSARRRIRGRRRDRREQAEGARRPPRAGPSGRDARQRSAAPLRREPFGHRRRAAARHRPPHRQGHVGARHRGQERRRAQGARGAAQGSHARQNVRVHRLRQREGGRRHHRRAHRQKPGRPQEDGRHGEKQPPRRHALGGHRPLPRLHAPALPARDGAARTRSACIWRGRTTRSWATRSTAARNRSWARRASACTRGS